MALTAEWRIFGEFDMDPQRFWTGVHVWFRSRGVDYDTPIATAGA